MSTQEPKLEDFGITPEEYSLLAGKGNERPPGLIGRVLIFAWVVVVAVIALLVFVVTGDLDATVASGFGSALPASFLCVGVAWLVETTIVRFKRSRLLKSSIVSQVKLYQEAWEVYQTYQVAQQEEAERVRLARQIRQQAEWAAEAARREALKKRREFWEGLSGRQFEHELGNLCKRRGYKVSFTPVSGDEGIDLILRKNGKTTVVQCKRHKSPTGPSVVRELYGSMVASRADNAILACTGGFTKGAREFASGKPITLVDASDLARMSESIEGNRETGG